MFDEFISWFHKEKYQILLTVFAALIPVCITFVHDFMFTSQGCACCADSINVDFKISDRANYAIQSIFIFITLFVLIKNKRTTYGDLNNDRPIKQYLVKICRIKMPCTKIINDRFHVVSETTMQFYRAWMFVWILWLAYYVGNLIFELAMPHEKNVHIAQILYSQFFDFLNSTAMFVIYLVLTNVTVNIRQRTNNDESYWYGIITWVIMFSVFTICMAFEVYYCMINIHFAVSQYVTSVVLSLFSAVSFMLVIGKLNSVYLQIPQFFLWVLYMYGIMQCYIPMSLLNDGIMGICNNYINIIIPYVTLTGKVFVMLTLCWIVNHKRIIYYIIHQSLLIEDTPRMLRELNRR